MGRYAGLIVSGYFKFTTLNELGDEAVINFAFPGQHITDVHSSVYGKPSEMSIIAGADSEILRVPLKKFMTFLSANVSAEHSALFRMTYMRYLSICRNSPEQRYIELCNYYPDLVNTVALKDIASYLLISPNHLSRIRRKLRANPQKRQRVINGTIHLSSPIQSLISNFASDFNWKDIKIGLTKKCIGYKTIYGTVCYWFATPFSPATRNWPS